VLTLPGRLQRKVLLIVSAIVVIPMLVAGWLAAEWVSTNFEKRLAAWIIEVARANQNWVQAYQTDAAMLGRVLADDPVYVPELASDPEATLPTPVANIAQELGLSLIQIYALNGKLLYSSIPVRVQTKWEAGQTEAVLRVVRHGKSMLAAVGITPVPRQGKPRYFLVVGSLLGKDFANELAQLTGLDTRLYYRDGSEYYDLFSNPDRPVGLKHLSAEALQRLEVERKPYYSVNAENGAYRGVYTPLVDSTGRVEAVMFSGLERRTVQDLLTNRIALFFWIALLGVVIGGLTGWLVSRLVLKPIGYLRNGVMQLAGRNYNANVPIHSDDELGDLAKAFNAMATRLRAAHSEEQRRFQRDKLAAMGELSAALAHEIRNPIGVINTSAALLEKPDLDPAKKSALTRMLREESMRVAQLVQDFLQLSRHRRPSLEAIDPAVPLERALTASLAGNDAIAVHKDFHHDGARIHADGVLLQQAWSNILANSIEAMAHANGGRELRIGSQREERAVSLTVEDNGPGIAPDILPRLFEPFFTTKQNGTGLGLSIAYSLVEANGGQLEALAPTQGGARFVMRFPLSEAQPESVK
jgi:two-component system, NtrC family, sensor kinase